jgi:putative membrane protein
MQPESTEVAMQGMLIKQLVSAAVFSAMGVAVFAIAFWVMCKVAGFSVRKEIAEDQNTALAIVMGSVILGIAIIVASAVNG